MTAPNQALEMTQRELVLTRIFDAPRPLVFQAWLDPERIAQWWGPNGFTTTVTTWEARPGGAIRLEMRGHGMVAPMGGVFHEVVAPERIVFTSTAFEMPDGSSQLENLNTVTFSDHGASRTKVSLHVVVKRWTPAISSALDGMEEGWSQSLDRLDDDVMLQSRHSADREITAHRLFQAPRELVWKMWTEPEHIVHWWGPTGFKNTTKSMDVRPGGMWDHVMHGPDGVDYPNLNQYVEIVKPDLIVYSHVSEPKHVVTVTFSEQVGKTRTTMRMLFESAALRDEVAGKYGAVEGMRQTLGRLEEYLSTRLG